MTLPRAARLFAAVGLSLLCSTALPGTAQADERDGFLEAAPEKDADSKRAQSGPADPSVAGEPAPLRLAAEPSPPARASAPPPDPPPSDPGAGMCLFLGDPACSVSPVIELGMGWGMSDTYLGTLFTYHPFVEVGLLTQVRGVPDLHMGPTFELGVDTGPSTLGFAMQPKVRARYFAGGTQFVLEGALGPAFSRFAFDEGTETGTRVGAGFDFGFGFAGVVGPWVSLLALNDRGGITEHELRWTVGFRTNLLAWGTLFSALGRAPIL